LLNKNQFLIIIKSIILKYSNSYFILLDIDKNQFKEKIIPRLSTIDVDVQLLKLSGFTLSSVLIIIHFRDYEPKIILTKRSSLLKYHKNEISFPGGTFKETDSSLLNTALRETKEEIGLNFDSNEILGCFQTVRTLTSNFAIIPFVTFQDSIRKTNLLIDEVSEVLDIPIFDLFKGLSSNFNYKNFSNSYSFRYNSEIIWGATARILKQIRDCFY
jgi:8-oxo-dGTP pyrophosphatase MutT (NUDIX family)